MNKKYKNILAASIIFMPFSLAMANEVPESDAEFNAAYEECGVYAEQQTAELPHEETQSKFVAFFEQCMKEKGFPLGDINSDETEL